MEIRSQMIKTLPRCVIMLFVVIIIILNIVQSGTKVNEAQ